MDIKEKLKNTLPDLHEAGVLGSEIFSPDIDYTRPLKEYPTANDIVSFLQSDAKPKHIYTKDLNKNGIAVQDAMDKYLEDDSKSSGMLKAAIKTPMHYQFAKDDDKRELEKLKGTQKHFELGNFLHEAILEPTKFGRVLVEPKYSLASKEGVNYGTEFWEQTIIEQGFGVDENGEELEGALVLHLSSEEVIKAGLSFDKQDGKKLYLSNLKRLSGMTPVGEENYLKIQILKKHYENYGGGGVLKRLLLHSKREISFYYTDPSTGIKLKVRPDSLQFKENIGVDAIISVKSSGTEDLKAFYYQAAKMHYDLSEGMYQEVISNVTGRDFNTTIMVFLQTVAPFAVAILVWSPEDIEMGKYKFRTALNIVNECDEKDVYPGYDAFAEEGNFGLITMELPQWNNSPLLPINTEN